MWHARAFKTVCNILLALILSFSIAAIPAIKPVHANSILVNSLSDLPDYAPLDGDCDTAMGANICTLRAALQTAYQYDTIDFDPSLNGYTIYLNHSGVSLESLVLAMNDVTIDGYGHNITVSGQYMSHAPGADMECLRIAGNSNWIQNITFRDCASWGIVVGDGDFGDNNTISAVTLLGNSSGGITFNEDDGDGSGGNNNYLQYSSIGTTSSSPSSCIVADENPTGVVLGKWVHGNHIEHSTIACNGFDGIDIYDADNNYIHGNVIGANGWQGVYMIDASYITMTENYFGVNPVGLGALGNAYNGIYITGGSDHGASRHITIGGASVSDGNLIGGNLQSGIFITGNSYDIDINNNGVGINAYQDEAIPNGNAGIAIIDNVISTGLANAIEIGDVNYTTSHQYISGNSREGIYIQNANNINIRDSNLIGRGDFYAAFDVPLGNGLEGVRIVDGWDNLVAGYAIAYNGGAGIAIEGNDSVRNFLHAQRIYLNGGLPIDLGNDGHTANDSGDFDIGPNDLLNYPEIIDISGGVMTGTVSCKQCRVYFFPAYRDPSVAGGGYRSDFVASAIADDYGIWTIAYPVGGTYKYNQLTMLTYDLNPGSTNGDTSELSPRPVMLTFLPLLKK
jgi:hypothetical protein